MSRNIELFCFYYLICYNLHLQSVNIHKKEILHKKEEDSVNIF